MNPDEPLDGSVEDVELAEPTWAQALVFDLLASLTNVIRYTPAIALGVALGNWLS